MKSKCDPSCRGIGTRRGQTYIVAQAKGKVNQLHRALDGYTAYLTITLHRMSIANGKERTRNRYGQAERTARHQFFAVHVPTTKPWSKTGIYARSTPRPPHHA